MVPVTPHSIAAKLAPHGLIMRGAFRPTAGDGVPEGPGGDPISRDKLRIRRG